MTPDDQIAEDASLDPLRQLAEAASHFEAREDGNPGMMTPHGWTFEQKQLAPYPPIFTYATSGLLSSTRDQGTWFACTSFAMVAAIEARCRKTNGESIHLVPGYLHNCLAHCNNPELGVDPSAAAELCRATGILYGENDAMPVANAVCQNAGRKFQIQSYGFHDTRDATYFALYTRGPLLVDMWVGPEFFLHRGNGIFRSPQHPENASLHTLAMVGYEIANGVEIVHVQHSGGPGWGVNGIGRIQIGSGGLLTNRQPLELLI